MPYRWTLTNLKTLDFEVLSVDPIGWDEASYTLSRSDKYKSVMHEYSTPLKFHCKGGGKDFIDTVYETDAIDGRIDILIEYDCDGRGSYDTLFNGIVNLATYTVENDYTICQIERSDLYTKFISRDEISVDLETAVSIGGEAITPINSVILPMQSSVVKFGNLWRTPDDYTYQYTKDVQVFGQPLFLPNVQFDFTAENSDINQSFSTSGTVTNFTSRIGSPMVRFNDNGITYPITINFSFVFKGMLRILTTYGSRGSDPPSQIFFGLYHGPTLETASVYTFIDDTSVPLAVDLLYPIDIDVTDSITINAGDSIWVSCFISDQFLLGTENTFTLSEPGIFSISSETTYRDSVAKSVLVHEAFNQVVDAIADSDGNFVSNFYGRTTSQKRSYAETGCGALIAITNGLNIRQFAGKQIYSSFNELFNAMDCLHNIGAGYVSNKIQVEPLSFWFDNTTRIISLPFVNQYTVKDDNKRYINKIDVGYQKWESQLRGGLDEPNSNHEYSTIVKSVNSTYQKLCSFIAANYAIEFTRRKSFELSSTEDWKYDNDNFLIAIKDTYTSTIYEKIIFNENLGVYIISLPGVNLQQFEAGDIITVTGGTLNYGIYTVVSVTNITDPPFTSIIVAESVVDESVDIGTIENNTRGLAIVEKYSDSFAAGSGMIGIDTAKNLRLTPARMLLAHLNVITAGLQKIKGFVKFVKGEGNTLLQLTKTDIGCPEDFDGQPLAENQSIEWSDDRARNIHPLWFPEIYTFDYPLTYEQFKTIKANPNGYIEFYRFENDKKAGYILSMEYQLKTGMTKFELLRIYAPEATGDEKGNYIGDETGALIGTGGG